MPNKRLKKRTPPENRATIRQISGEIRSYRPDEVAVLIIGGGPVGSALACALDDAGVSVALVEREDPARLAALPTDGRAYAIALASRRLLERIGIWRRLAGTATPILDIRITDAGSPFFLHYDHREVGTEPFGHLVPAEELLRAMAEEVAMRPGVLRFAPATVSKFVWDEHRAAATLADGRRIAARLAVAADGRRSATRAAAGIGVRTLPYRQTAIVCTIAHERPHACVAYELFRPAGPFAILPLAGNRSSIVWAEDASTARALMALDEPAFVAELQARAGDFLGRLSLAGPRVVYPLSLQFALRPTARRLALVGDAAHAIHPVAGQGLNLGLRDVAALAETIVEARALGLDIGDAFALEDYARRRGFDGFGMIAATDGIVRLFSNRSRTLRLIRGLGLAAVGRVPPLKRLFMREAMGLIGTLPALMQTPAARG